MRAGWLVVIGTVACGTIRKPPEPDRRLDLRTTGSTFETDHGFRFVVLPEPMAKLVRVDFRYPVGSVDDPKGKEGLAHLVEHLLFDVEYATGETKTSISAELAKVTLSTNAFTTADHTTYVSYADPAALDSVFGLEVNRLAIGCGGLTPDIFKREREVVINELRQRQGGTGVSISRALHDAVYPAGHPYRAIDTAESVAKIELADVCSFLAGVYQRGVATIVVSGDVDVAAVQKAASRHLVRVKKRAAGVQMPVPAVANRPGVERLKVDIEEPTLVITWPLPATSTRDYRFLELAWPHIAWRLENFGSTFGWGHSVSTAVIGGDRAPVLAISITLTGLSKDKEAIDAAVKSVDHAVEMMGTQTNSDRWRANWQGRIEHLLARWESIDGRNEMAADLAEDKATLIARVDELVKATPGEARSVIENHLGRERARYLVLEPSGVGGSSGMRTYAGGAEAHATRVDPSLADQPLPPPTSNPLVGVQRYRLANGLTVLLWPQGTSPLVHGRLVIDSGTSQEPIGQEGLALLIGASRVQADTMVFDGRTLGTRVDMLVGSLASELRSPGYGLDDDAKKFLKGRLHRQRAKARLGYEHELLVGVYGDKHPYARGSMTEDSIDRMDHDGVTTWARDHVVASNATLIIAGKFDPALVKHHIAYNADHVKAGSDSKDVDAVPQPKVTWAKGVDTVKSPTVSIDIHFQAGRGIDADHAKRLVLEQVIDGRLAALRSKQAVTYGFSSAYIPRRGGGMWSISGEVDATRSGEASKQIMAILDELRSNPDSYRADFVMARQKVIEGILLMGTSSHAVVERLVEVARFDIPDNFYDQVAQSVAKLTIADFKTFIGTELPHSKMVFGAFGDEAAVSAAISAAQDQRIVDPFQ